MFEIPEAKRVRREDLFDEEDAGASSDDGNMDHRGPVDPELQGKLNAHLAGLLGMDLAAFTAPCHQDGLDGATNDDGDAAVAGGEDEDEDAPMADDAPPAAAADEEVAFQFRLFRGETPSHTVVIKPHEDDDAAATGPGALVHARRPQSYYVAGEPDAQAAERFRLAAVSADYLLADAQRGRRWGLETPWRVAHITLTPTKTTDDNDDDAAAQEKKKKKRPGKKRRIILRGRVKARKEKEEAAKRQAIEKEEHLLDKKKRLNRQKKLRRRAKKREGKTADGGEPADDDGSSRATTPE